VTPDVPVTFTDGGEYGVLNAPRFLPWPAPIVVLFDGDGADPVARRFRRRRWVRCYDGQDRLEYREEAP
jgi:hypothetical protein